MKGVIKLLMFLLVFHVSDVYAEAVSYGKIRLCANGCNTATGNDPSDYVYSTSEATNACIALSSYVEGQAKIYNISCPGGINEYETTDVIIQNIIGVPVGTETDAGRAAFDAWSATFTPPLCASSFANGAIGEGYIFITEPGSVQTESTIHLTMWKRRDCSTAGGGLLEPIGTIGGGGGSTDMTATNTAIGETNTLIAAGNTESAGQTTLLEGIKTAVEAGGGGGGTATDMTATNDLLTAINTDTTETKTGIASIVESLSGSSGLGGYVDNTLGHPAFSSSYFEANMPTSSSYINSFQSFETQIKTTSLYGLIGGFFGSAPLSGNSVYSFSAGSFGNHSYDFASWSSILTLLRGLVLVAFAAASIRIVLLKGGN